LPEAKILSHGAKKSKAFLSLDLVFSWDETCCTSGKKGGYFPALSKTYFSGLQGILNNLVA
jgi:hypothetical protein